MICLGIGDENSERAVWQLVALKGAETTNREVGISRGRLISNCYHTYSPHPIVSYLLTAYLPRRICDGHNLRPLSSIALGNAGIERFCLFRQSRMTVFCLVARPRRGRDIWQLFLYPHARHL